MNSNETHIRNNLYEFYDQIAQICKIHSEKQDHWSVISNIKGVWPRIIYQIDAGILDQQLSEIFSEKVNTGHYPELLIASDENIRQIDSFLRKHGFYPFSAWKGMALGSLKDHTTPSLPETVHIVKVASPTDLEQWLKIVSLELIAPSLLNKNLMKRLLAQSAFEAYLLKYNDIGVSTILIFESTDSTGLYLIATEKSSQKQGFASLLVQYILSQNTKRSNKPVILHATRKGEPLYSKLGFLPFNQFFLYRYIKTDL